MKRRDFIRKASAAAIGSTVIPTIIPSSALGLNGKTPPSDRIVMAAVGIGGMGKGNMGELLKAGAQFVAVCDLDEERRKQGKYALWKYYDNKDANEYKDYRTLLRKEEIDAVMIAVPDHWHAILYKEFASRGIHIYGEKPLVRKINEGKEIVKVVEDSNIVWQTGSWQRSHDRFIRACNLIANNTIGKIQKIEVGLPDLDKTVGMPAVQSPPETIDYDFWLGPAPYKEYRGILHWDWRWIQSYSAGQLSDWGAHHIDIALMAMKMDRSGPVEIKGTGKFNKGDLFDVAYEFNIDYKLPDGTPMKVCNSALQPHGMGVSWYGENNQWIHVDRSKMTASNPALLETAIAESDQVYKNKGEHRANFLDAIKKNDPTWVTAPIQSAHKANTASLLGEIAIMTGETLKWDPKQDVFTNASAKAKEMLSRPYRSPWKL